MKMINNRRKEYNKIDITFDETKQLISNEVKLIKQYDIQKSDWNDFGIDSYELGELTTKAKNIEYEIEKIKNDIKLQELQTNKMKSTILSQNCSFNNIDSLMLSKIKKNMNVNRSIEVQSQYTYTYKEKN